MNAIKRRNLEKGVEVARGALILEPDEAGVVSVASSNRGCNGNSSLPLQGIYFRGVSCGRVGLGDVDGDLVALLVLF